MSQEDVPNVDLLTRAHEALLNDVHSHLDLDRGLADVLIHQRHRQAHEQIAQGLNLAGGLAAILGTHEYSMETEEAIQRPDLCGNEDLPTSTGSTSGPRADPKRIRPATAALELYVNTMNRDPRAACVMLIDVSGSMSQYQSRLEDGFRVFVKGINDDPVARKRAEVPVVTFGSNAQVHVPFREARDLTPTTFRVSGTTNMAAAFDLALEILEERKAQYRAEGIEYFRPWMFVLTDGAPDRDGFEAARQRLNQAERAKKVAVFGVGVGDAVDFQTLATISTERPPLALNQTKFREMFEWLSGSLSAVSESGSFGVDDTELSDTSEVIQLAPPGWGSVV
jgi:uncharacterized protein YegL